MKCRRAREGTLVRNKTADAREKLSIPNRYVSFETASRLTVIYRQHFCLGVLP